MKHRAKPVLANASSSSCRRLAKTGRARLAPIEVRHGKCLEGYGVTYELRHVLCGKKHCRKLHGPYWYAYWRASSRLQHLYIGRVWCSVDDKFAELRSRANEEARK